MASIVQSSSDSGEAPVSQSRVRAAARAFVAPFSASCAKLAAGQTGSSLLLPTAASRQSASVLMDAVYGDDGNLISSVLRDALPREQSSTRSREDKVLQPGSLEATLAGTTDIDSGVSGASLCASSAASIANMSMQMQKAVSGMEQTTSEQNQARSTGPAAHLAFSPGGGRISSMAESTDSIDGTVAPLSPAYVRACRGLLRLQDDLQSDRPASRAAALEIIASKVASICEPATADAVQLLADSSDALVDSGLLELALACISDSDSRCREACAGVLLALARCMDSDRQSQRTACLALPRRSDELGDGFVGG